MRKIIEPCGLHCIKMRHITVAFGEQVVLEDVNLHIHCGTLTAIIGKNGAGKSTLVKALLDDIPHSGEIEFRNLKNEKIQKLKIGYVPQKINIEKYTPLSVYDLFASYQGKAPAFFIKSRKLYAQVKELLRVFEAEELVDKQVCNLSGGQLQRVLLSLAVMNGPDLLLLDEPEAGIDKKGMELFYKNIEYLKKHFDLAVILISHDLEYVRRYADHVVLLDKKILCQGSAHEVFESEEFKKEFAVPAWQTLADIRKSPAEAGKPLTDCRKSPTEARKPLTDCRKSPAEAGKPLTDIRKSPAEARKSSADCRKSSTDIRRSAEDGWKSSGRGRR